MTDEQNYFKRDDLDTSPASSTSQNAEPATTPIPKSTSEEGSPERSPQGSPPERSPQAVPPEPNPNLNPNRSPTAAENEDAVDAAARPFELRPPDQAESKVIVKNMTEVLQTLSKRHREKHRRRRQEKHRARREARNRERVDRAAQEIEVSSSRERRLKSGVGSTEDESAAEEEASAKKLQLFAAHLAKQVEDALSVVGRQSASSDDEDSESKDADRVCSQGPFDEATVSSTTTGIHFCDILHPQTEKSSHAHCRFHEFLKTKKSKRKKSKKSKKSSRNTSPPPPTENSSLQPDQHSTMKPAEEEEKKADAMKSSDEKKVDSKTEVIPSEPKKAKSTDSDSDVELVEVAKAETDLAKAKATPVNAFLMMMSARTQSPGANSDSLDMGPSTSAQAAEHRAEQQKRRQILQELNDRKGGTKRKLAEEARAEYVQQQMDDRAKRFKQMLTNPGVSITPKPVAEETPIKRGRGRPRIKRPSPPDAAAIYSPSTPSKKSEDGDQEGSTKKQPLTYVSKKVSPKKATKATKSTKAATDKAQVKAKGESTPKRKPKKSQLKPGTFIDYPSDVELTPTGRPRRSCTGSARYDIDNENSMETIDLDTVGSPVSTPKALAPLFVRRIPKPGLDPAVLKARQAFLHSGMPEEIRVEQNRQKQFELEYLENFEYFPSLSHILQQDDGLSRPLSIVKTLTWPLRSEEIEVQIPPFSWRGMQYTSSMTSGEFKPRKGVLLPLPFIENKRDIVRLWKKPFEKFPIYKCYNQMKNKYIHFSALDTEQDTRQVSESFMVSCRSRRSMEIKEPTEEDMKPPEAAPNGELLFTEKYRPWKFEEFLVNLTPAQQLKDFLSAWNDANSPDKDDDSFYLDTDSNFRGIIRNVAVLVGPSSSGKTSALTAMANELNFNVLEVNAGMDRRGKKMMTDLQESTKSHQIRKDNRGFATPQDRSKKSKKRQKSIDDPNAIGNVRKSLILIEDADVLFENMDSGFTDAIYTLAATSKRPVVVVASDSTCPHLQRLMQQNTINFKSHHVLNISRFLTLLSLMENCPIELDDMASLYIYNRRNLRRTLLEIQFFIQSGGDRQNPPKSLGVERSPAKTEPLLKLDDLYIHEGLFQFFTCTQNFRFQIPYPVDFQLLRSNLSDIMQKSPYLVDADEETNGACGGSNRLVLSASQNNRTPLDRFCEFYENITAASLLSTWRDPTDRQSPHATEEITHTLVEQAVRIDLEAGECGFYMIDTFRETIKIYEELGNKSMRNTTARNLDYEPILRTICRTERHRSSLERRSSRFYHYIRNLSPDIATFNKQPLKGACRVFQNDLWPSSESENDSSDDADGEDY